MIAITPLSGPKERLHREPIRAEALMIDEFHGMLEFTSGTKEFKAFTMTSALSEVT
jgi:hypothetical protein